MVWLPDQGVSRAGSADFPNDAAKRVLTFWQARELQDTIAEVRAMLSELRATEGGGTESVALEALLEVRAMLRAIAAVRDPLIVTNAREQARNEIAALRSNK
jgi:hypothetical protein